MKKIFITVGPAQLYPTVPKHIRTAIKADILSLSHRSDKFVEIYKTTSNNLRKLLNIPTTHHIFFMSSALEAMERVIQNTVNKNSFHFVNGSFSKTFWQTAVDYQKNAERFEVEAGRGFDFDVIKIPKTTELITIVQNETSTGAAIPLSMIYELKKQNPKTLIAMDIVSSVPYPKVDFSMIDIALFSVQKGFGLPAGLGVLIVNDKALEKAKQLEAQNTNVGSYHKFSKLLTFEQKFQTPETPNVLNIYLLGKVAEDMLKIGIEKIRNDTNKKAALIYNFFDSHSSYKPFVKAPFRSSTTIVIDVKGESDIIVKKLAVKGLVVAKGYGKNKDTQIRIGNFPTHKMSHIKKLLQLLKVL